jgi:LmbE family N-acetylglucosaminyl deacetylase
MNQAATGPRDRLLVVAPHPDDETLACGGLIQRTRAAGGAVRVLLATGGETNPWPQRVSERRWRLDADAGVRWGARRRGELLAALRVLGLDEDALVPLGLPDQGVTEHLLADATGLQARLASLMQAFAPTRVAYPHVADAHPDHSALAFVAEAAIARCVAHGLALPERLVYLVHGARGMATAPIVLRLGADEYARKREAALAHASQALFGRARLLRLASAVEGFHPPPTWPTPQRDRWQWSWRGHWPLAATATPDCALVWLGADGCLHARRLSSVEIHAHGGRWRRGSRRIRLALPSLADDARAAWAKPVGGHRWLAYDGFRWQPAA